ncbi:hypothetical protein IW261DRAFT_1511467 [Armillaria novae-zelandiae]|uniref:Actin-like ATPase domain-containing protein n=1 Tax=Armillaria novae-zelandiae TaxID=153914 RepID=A0AA39TVX2_9AGAR|nr:hypothetical protein IW261DRAFT_1511467 [Armillaria novae-zelandiae]
MAGREAYSGSHRKLAIAFDLGTTFSGISYSVLDPGNIPEIKGVTRFPSQEHVGSDAKIPTTIYYDQEGKVRAVGAEALKQNVIEQAEDEGWVKYSGFKLHLRPKQHHAPHISSNLPPLPPNKTVIQIFSDFYAYLFQCAKSFILETHQSALVFWNSVEDHIEFILSHPNGWQAAQQSQMRQAVVDAGLVPDNEEGHARVQFVTEGEASLHFCVHHGLSSYLKDNEAVVIIDAGGGTVDISSYTTASSNAPEVKSFQEVAVPQCSFIGSLFVTKHAKAFIENKLKGSKFAEEVENIAECFDKTTKLRFRNEEEPAYVKFGSMKDKDLALDIRSGQLKLTGSEVASFFEPSIKAIIDVVHEQRLVSAMTVSTIFLVGGFAASDWVFLKLQEYLTPLGIAFSRPDSHVNKAVADGAMTFYLDRAVTSRVSKFDYGVETSRLFVPGDPEHEKRKDKAQIDASGDLRIGYMFNTILTKNTHVYDETEFRRTYYRSRTHLSMLSKISTDILYYRGSTKEPQWIDVEPDMYSVVCGVTADTREAAKGLKLRRRPDGKGYFKLEYDMILLFGKTELKAQICWKEDGVEKRGPARVVYDRDL